MSNRRTVDLNSDLGEGFGAWRMGDDSAMLDIVSSANLACGFHAGDPIIMADTAATAKAKGVDIGAHPSFFDLYGFGRRQIRGDSPADIEKMVAYQIGALQAAAALSGHRVTHVKPHGSMGNMAAVEADLALAIGRAIKGVDSTLIYVVMPGSQMERAAERLGLTMAREVFADRAYDDDGNLVSRKIAGSVIHDPAEAARRTVAMVRDSALTSTSGKRIPVKVDTICVHGDNPAAVELARAVRAALEAAGFAIAPMRTALAA